MRMWCTSDGFGDMTEGWFPFRTLITMEIFVHISLADFSVFGCAVQTGSCSPPREAILITC